MIINITKKLKNNNLLIDSLSKKSVDYSTSNKKAKVFIAEQGYDQKNGVRPLKRAIQRLFEDPISELIIDSKLEKGETINVTLAKDKKTLVFKHKK